VSRGSKAPGSPLIGPPFMGKRRFNRPSPVQELLLCAKHLFVAAMVAGVHPGKPEHEPEGQSAFEGLKFSGTGGAFFGRPELTSEVQRQTDIAMTNEAGRR
jgi:hypothetical protein